MGTDCAFKWATAASIVLVFSAITLVLWSGAHDVVSGRMTAGTLSQFVLYAVIGAGSVGALAEVWNDIQRASGGMGRISELLHEHSTIRAPAQPESLPQPVQGEIVFDDVTFHYPLRPELPAEQARVLAHAAFGLMNSTPFIRGEVDRERRAELLRDAAMAALSG